MNRALPLILLSHFSLVVAVAAQTNFSPTINSDIYNSSNWSSGLPSTQVSATIEVDGTGSANQGNDWMAGSKVVVSGGATLNLSQDLGARGGILTINNATINALDDIFSGNNGTIIFNAGSKGNSGDDFQAQAGATGGSVTPSSITINGGTHTAVDLFGSQSGQNSLVMTGGQITAGNYVFAGDGNSVSGSALLLSASGATTLSMAGTTNILSDWTGSWTIGSFEASDWRDEILSGDWTLESVAIDGTLFDSNFKISNDGQTLSLLPEPSSYAAFVGLLALTHVVLRRQLG